jgi:hypothetical protein
LGAAQIRFAAVQTGFTAIAAGLGAIMIGFVEVLTGFTAGRSRRRRWQSARRSRGRTGATAC